MTMMKVNAGELRTSITFQSPTIAKDGGGAQVPTYANVATNPTVQARWINDHGAEAVASEAVRSTQRATVVVRYRSDIVATWRVVKDSENWQILSVDAMQGRRYVELRVERVKGTV